MSYSTPAPETLDLDVLAHRCAEQTERFFRKQSSQDGYCFELLRRAFILRSQAAWERLYSQYRALVAGWVQKHAVFAACNEDVDFFVNGSFARFGRWCTPERFARLGGLPQWLAALKACIHSEIIDYHRQHVASVSLEEWNEEIDDSHRTAPHATVMDAETRTAFWRLVQERLQTEQERVLVEYDFVLGYKAREICILRPDLFADVQEVYRVKDNLLRRMRRDPALRRFLEE
jgi:hypothetical protein